ncbi:MAG: FecR domain-containing protein [Acidobacteria bacterium]|nr:FecR domain-containing protein [Acidobacteriota bacterium]
MALLTTLCEQLLVGQSTERPLATVVVAINQVQFSPAGTGRWYSATTNTPLYVGDQLTTTNNSYAKIQFRDGSLFPVNQLSSIEFRERPDSVAVRLWRGMVAFFYRDRPGHFEIEAGGVNMVVRGTEFALEVRANETAVLTLYDGRVEMRDSGGRSQLFSSGDVVTVRPRAPPRKTASVVLGDWSAVQWALYYPAILAPDDVGWTKAPDAAIARSWELYLRGNLTQALATYPTDRAPASPKEQLFLAALLLAVGNVAEAERWLEQAQCDERLTPLVGAHRQLIATVLRRPTSGTRTERSETEHQERAPSATTLLAESCRLQVEGCLLEARQHARAATERSPNFGLAWIRLAGLEFSFGNVRPAQKALARGLELAPDNAEGHALRGFLLAAGNRIREAQAAFQAALSLDPALGNAWLGRGLCRIRRGDLQGGRADLMVAAASEPQRSELRSYLAKAFADAKPFRLAPLADRAGHELDLARRLDPRDPTPWLYSALLNQQGNHINDAVADLERSVELNTNRFVYRSQLLLDQDRAVRGANLANIYADAGLTDMSVREATRAVNSDYANASAHLFLANSYNALRDPRQVNVRYEAPWFSEFLLANLLAPVGAGTLSQTVSQGEYSKLFQRDGVGLVR